jgi:hypothetical protein
MTWRNCHANGSEHQSQTYRPTFVPLLSSKCYADEPPWQSAPSHPRELAALMTTQFLNGQIFVHFFKPTSIEDSKLDAWN